jgi:putative membrane-bound dehydrogenase-like protein
MRQRSCIWFAAVGAAVVFCSPALAQPAAGIKVPPGFTVAEYAGSNLANDIYTMTVDPRGRIVVAGRGYIRILVDSKGAGKADKAIQFADGPKDGAMGLLWEGDTLYVSGDGGLRKFTATADGDHAAGPSQLIRALKTGREHGAHALRRGPDGWLYVLCGNETGIDGKYAQLPTSPVQQPTAGCVLRFTPDLKQSEIVAHGFRNPYGMDFNCDGELFTFDSDNERCVALPWYEPTRFYHVIPGGFYGWLSPQHAQFWRCPPWFVDVVAPAATLGRGSPTGVACYRHVAFPKKYHGGIFVADWTFGKIYHLELVRDGSSYTCKKSLFLEATGDNGFAPTALVVHPKTGDLFVSIGGRGTRGAVYRIHWESAPKSIDKAAVAKLQFAPRSLDWQPDLHKSLLKKAESSDQLERVQALNLLTRHSDHFKLAPLIAAIKANWREPDRYLRQAAAALVAKLTLKQQHQLWQQATQAEEKITVGLARYASQPQQTVTEMRKLLESSKDNAARLEGLRVLQLAMGDIVAPKVQGQVWEGYTTRKPMEILRKQFGQKTLDEMLKVVRTDFVKSNQPFSLELARTLALLEDSSSAALESVANEMAQTKSAPDQLHYLIVMGRLGAPRNQMVTQQTATALLGLEEKVYQQGLYTDSHWPLRLQELYAELARRDPKLNASLLHHKDFGRPAHALFALTPGFDGPAAATLFLKKAIAEANYPWNAALVSIVGKLPPQQSFPALRPLWGKAGLDSAILPVLAKQPDPQDRNKFIAGLKSPQLTTVQTSLSALKKLPVNADDEELLALLTALQRLPEGKAKELATDLGAHLDKVTGQKFGTERKAWIAWFEKTYPKLAAKLTNVDGVDIAAWKKRFAQLKLDTGDTERGATLFRKFNCAACHGGGQWLGPDLHGVAKRFSAEDLLWAIVQPSKDVPERYQLTLLETRDGKIYQGMIIYEAPDGVLLQIGANTTVRIPGSKIASQQTLPNSLMPSGLLEQATDQNIADLFAYLRSL